MNAVVSSITSDTYTLIALLFTIMLCIATIGFSELLGRRTVGIARSLKTTVVPLLEAKVSAPSGGMARLLVRALHDRIAYVDRNPLRFVTRGLDDEHVEAAAESMLEHGAGRWVLRIGEHLTAIALILTFSLLGLVITQDVTQAIQASSADREPLLVHAFAKMGGKFFISAVGLLGAVIFRWTRDAAVKRVTRAVQELLEENSGSFVSLEQHRFECSLADREAIQQSIIQAAHSMSSIEVSVKDMGIEVSTHLGKLMKESIADEFAKNLGELRATVEALADRVERTLTDALAAQVQEVLRALEAVRATVHDRAGGEVESLLDRMKDLLSGGFQSAQGDMSRQMGSLTEQLAALVAQVSEVSQRTAGEASSRSAEMRASMEALLARTNEVLEAMQTAQKAVATSSTTSANYVRNEVAAAVAETKNVTSALDTQARHIQATLEKIAAELGTALKNTIEIAKAFGTQASDAQKLSKVTYDAALKFASGSANIQQAAAKFDENLRALQESIEHQRASQQEFARVVPESISRVQARLTEQTRELSSAWVTLQGALSKSVNTIGTALSEPIENLGDHVEALVRATGANPGARK